MRLSFITILEVAQWTLRNLAGVIERMDIGAATVRVVVIHQAVCYSLLNKSILKFELLHSFSLSESKY
jgi:uncharacterized membrane protein